MAGPSVIHRYPHARCVLVAIAVLACGPRTNAGSIEGRFTALNKVEEATSRLPYRAKSAMIGTSYDVLFTTLHEGGTQDRINDSDLNLLYRAAQLAAFYTLDARRVAHMAQFVAELEQRGLASEKHYKAMQEAFIGARMLTEAGLLAERHPLAGLAVMPALREAGDLGAGVPTEWAVDPSKHELLRRGVDLHRPVHIMVISHPRCHFSQNAAEALQADAVLGSIFRMYARWLSPQDGHLDLEVFQQWNREHPEQEITMAFRREEWPMIDTWGTPTFYFFKNGDVKAKIVGWPKEGRRAELFAAVRDVGLLQ